MSPPKPWAGQGTPTSPSTVTHQSLAQWHGVARRAWLGKHPLLVVARDGRALAPERVPPSLGRRSRFLGPRRRPSHDWRRGPFFTKGVHEPLVRDGPQREVVPLQPGLQPPEPAVDLRRPQRDGAVRGELAMC